MMLSIYATALDLIHHLGAVLVDDPDSAKYLTRYEWRLVVVAAYTILRIVKSPIKDLLDVQDAERAIFSAIYILKQRSVQTDDLEAINALMLLQLWSSKKVYVREGKQDGLVVALRHRSASSNAPPNTLRLQHDQF